MLAGKYDVKRI